MPPSVLLDKVGGLPGPMNPLPAYTVVGLVGSMASALMGAFGPLEVQTFSAARAIEAGRMHPRRARTTSGHRLLTHVFSRDKKSVNAVPFAELPLALRQERRSCGS